MMLDCSFEQCFAGFELPVSGTSMAALLASALVLKPDTQARPTAVPVECRMLFAELMIDSSVFLELWHDGCLWRVLFEGRNVFFLGFWVCRGLSESLDGIGSSFLDGSVSVFLLYRLMSGELVSALVAVAVARAVFVSLMTSLQNGVSLSDFRMFSKELLGVRLSGLEVRDFFFFARLFSSDCRGS